MKTLWDKFTAWLSGWPEGTREGKKIKGDQELFREQEAKSKPKVKPKKVKGLNPKKKRVKKQ
jgi:hypothetical protein